MNQTAASSNCRRDIAAYPGLIPWGDGRTGQGRSPDFRVGQQCLRGRYIALARLRQSSAYVRTDLEHPRCQATRLQYRLALVRLMPRACAISARLCPASRSARATSALSALARR